MSAQGWSDLAAVMLFSGLGYALVVGVDLLVTSYREGPHR